MSRRRVAIVLAAGRGSRMQSVLPKVLHRTGGKPLLAWVLDTAAAVGCDQTIVVVGHEADRIRAAFADREVTWVEQTEQRGTGHALQQVAGSLTAEVERATGADSGQEATLLVLSGDVPLLTEFSLRQLLDAAEAGWGSMAVAESATPGSLGRVFAGESDHLGRIVEASDATPKELEERTVNAGLYALPAPEIFDWLAKLDTSNAQGELYLTDAVTDAAAAGRPVRLVELADASEAYGVNDRQDLARVESELNRRTLDRLMASGVTIVDPARTVAHAEVEVGRDTVLAPDVSLLGRTRIGEACDVQQGAWILDCEIGDRVEVRPYSVLDRARVGEGSHVGPFARLRPGAELAEDVGVGNFVEVKNSKLERGVKAGHLSYLGDAQIGAGANIGAGTVTCNYDGVAKHRTEIGEQSFIGSDTMLVAPVRVGDRALTGAGSVISKDVPDDGLGIGRARQRNIEDWTERQQAKKRNAAARGTQFPGGEEPKGPESRDPGSKDSESAEKE